MPGLIVQFVALAAVVAAAGTFLARSADRIAEATGLGRLSIGSVLLAAATSLPELSVDIAAVRAGMTDLATGDLLGSSLMNLLILAGVDLAQRSGRRMLSREAASHALSATLSIALAALVADELATESGLGRTFVGTTFVALTTSLPELVASIAAVRLGAFDLAIGNTFGSNAFNMIMFVPLDFVPAGPLFAAVSPVHAVTALSAIVATAIAVLGQLYHEEKRIPVVEPDAVLVFLVVIGGLAMVYRLS